MGVPFLVCGKEAARAARDDPGPPTRAARQGGAGRAGIPLRDDPVPCGEHAKITLAADAR
jgi:hypothetical protein